VRNEVLISLREDLEQNKTCTFSKDDWFEGLSIGWTVLVLGLYGFTMIWVIYHAGKKLELSAYLTIGVFFSSEVFSLIFYILNMKSDLHWAPVADVVL